MAKNLYLSLVSGRTVHVTDDWDGNAPTRIGTVDTSGAPDDGEGIETAEYYRDIFRSYVEINSGASGVAPGPHAGKASVPGVATALTGSASLSSTVITPTISPLSDEAAHTQPRTFQKVVTWLVFNCVTSGQTRGWRASSVDGWSDQPPLD